MACRKYIILIFLIWFSSCISYSFKGSLPSGVDSVAISQIINNTSEYPLTNLLNDNLNRELLNQNILDIVDIYTADTSLNIIIESVKDDSNIYTSSNDNLYETVQQWKLTVKVKVNWYNINDNSIILDRYIEEWALYNNSGIDINADGIDNDSDGLIDGNDSDEYGSAREAALRITSQKIINRIINELISNW
tara:strand:+ start:1252 stop:1827 length:576 start_codon:yes stop_codon:yes gene_type:complete